MKNEIFGIKADIVRTETSRDMALLEGNMALARILTNRLKTLRALLEVAQELVA